MVWTRRAAMAGTAALALAGRARAAPPDGAVALVVTRAGIGGLIMVGENGATLDPDAAWHIGSNTKAMTALLYACAVERGRCRWGADVASLFPGMPAHPAWREVPVEALMAHAAGLDDRDVTPAWLDERRRDPASAPDQRRAWTAQLLARAPDDERGRYAYANANFVVLGAALEAALGMSWEEAMRRHLFAPLAMLRAGFGAPAALWGRREGPVGPVPVDPAGVADNPVVLWPSGGVHLTPGDYARFLQLFLTDGAPLLAAGTLERLLTPPAPALPYAGGWLRPAPGTLTHDGSNTFWYARATIRRDAGRAVVAMTNRGGAAGQTTVAALIRALG